MGLVEVVDLLVTVPLAPARSAIVVLAAVVDVSSTIAELLVTLVVTDVAKPPPAGDVAETIMPVDDVTEKSSTVVVSVAINKLFEVGKLTATEVVEVVALLLLLVLLVVVVVVVQLTKATNATAVL